MFGRRWSPAGSTLQVYRFTLIDASGTRRIGTQRRLYDRSTYRGRQYSSIEVTDTVMPETMQRTYFVWSNGHFHQAALERRDAQGIVVEALFDVRTISELATGPVPQR